MPKDRSYKLLCPIARGLDRVGDRWTLLILRDLHAGPARFSGLQSGLRGIAANLLTDRLGQLIEDGLVTKIDAGRSGTYALTDLGRETQALLLELALFGARFPAKGPVQTPGNLRTVITTLTAAAAKVAPADLSLRVQLMVGDEPMHLSVQNGTATGAHGVIEPADVTLETSYEALLSLTEGEMPIDIFLAEHAVISAESAAAGNDFQRLMHALLTLFSA